VAWALSDLAVTGHPLWSLTNTQHTATQLRRPTGLVNLPYYGARRLGEVLGPDGLVAAAIGGILSLWWARSRALLGAAAGLLAVLALALVAASGLPIQDRYVFLAAAIALVFGGAGLFGWRTLGVDHPHRRHWQAASLVIVAAVLVSIAWSVPRFEKTFSGTRPADRALSAQQRIQDDLIALTRRHAVDARCEPIGVPFATPVPLLALELHTSPSEIRVAQIGRGTIVVPANATVRTEYLLDPKDRQIVQRIPARFRLTARNRSWRVYTRCA